LGIRTTRSPLRNERAFAFKRNYDPMEPERFFVYVIYSRDHDKFYRGVTVDPERRLFEHNEGFSRWTSQFRPWELFYLEVYEFKRDALIREKVLKKYSKDQLRNLRNTNHPKRFI
jgi:putative endonuclease